MRLVEVKLSNFRSYEQGTTITIDPLTVLIGKNDAGKSLQEIDGLEFPALEASNTTPKTVTNG